MNLRNGQTAIVLRKKNLMMKEQDMSIAKEAQELVNGQRRQDYGDMKESFKRIAKLWSAYTGAQIDEFDVAKMMMLLKISRAKHNNHRDSYVDIVGYVECVDQMLETPIPDSAIAN